MNKKFILFVLLITAVACKEKIPESKEVARVGNSVLTEKDLAGALGSKMYANKFKEEYIRQWIRTEALFLKSKQKNITNDSLFNAIVHQSQKELASALLLQKVVEDSNVTISKSEIKRFYDSHREEFSLPFNAYVLNIIQFTEENNAIQFRHELLSSKWGDVVKRFSNKKSIASQIQQKIIYENEIQPKSLLRITQQMGVRTVSVVLETEPGLFTVVQLIDKIKKGSVPKLRYISNQIEERLKIIHEKQIVKHYLENLYNEFKVHITRD